MSILSLLTKHNFVVDQTVIYQPSFQVVTLHLTFSSTGCEPAETQTLLPRNLSKTMMVLFISLLKCINSSALKLLLPSRNTTLRPSTSLPRKEVFMSLTLLIMNHPHQRIPLNYSSHQASCQVRNT